MSLSHDRAVAIADAIRSDSRKRRVFLMPRDRFLRCRIVSATADDAEVLEFLTDEGVRALAEFGPGATADDIETRICRATGQPMFHREQQRSQVIDSYQSGRLK